MSKTWFTSDLHFGHVNILKYAPQRFAYLGIDAPASLVERCFAEVAAHGEEIANPVSNAEIAQYSRAMNEGIVDLWNTQVASDDYVVVVGDVAMGKVHENIEYVRQLNGTKDLFLGNHDRPHPIATRDAEKRAAWETVYHDVGFRTILFDSVLTFDGIVANVCHFPYYGDHTMDRYNADDIAKYVLPDDGQPLVHGHVHDMFQTLDNQYNVGIDAWDGVFQTAESISAYFRGRGFA